MNTGNEDPTQLAARSPQGAEMSDIVERLRYISNALADVRGACEREAADTIEALRGQLQTALDRETATTARYDARVAELEAENARLRATNETLQRQNDIAEARVRAWHGAVYMVDQNPKLRPVQPTPFGDDVPPILALRSEKLITLLDKVNRLREALEEAAKYLEAQPDNGVSFAALQRHAAAIRALADKEGT